MKQYELSATLDVTKGIVISYRVSIKDKGSCKLQ